MNDEITITIKGWESFQHYKERRPPWIKLYRSLIDKIEWGLLSDGAARLLVELWILASESDGCVRCSSRLLAFRLRRSSNWMEFLQELLAADFIECASGALATCEHGARPETEERRDRGETEEEAEGARPDEVEPQPCPMPKPTDGLVEVPAKGNSDRLTTWWVTRAMVEKLEAEYPRVDVLDVANDMARQMRAGAKDLVTPRGGSKALARWVNTASRYPRRESSPESRGANGLTNADCLDLFRGSR